MSGDKDEIHLDDDDPMPGNRIVPPQPKQQRQQAQPVQQQPQRQQPPPQGQQPAPQGQGQQQPKKKKHDRRVDLYLAEADFLFIRELSTELNQGFGKTVMQAIHLLKATTEKEKAFAERKKQVEGQQQQSQQ